MRLSHRLGLAAIFATMVTMLSTALNPLSALTVGESAPSLASVTLVRGDAIQPLNDGTISVVEFWATWCGPCITTIPHLTELQKANPQVQFIGLSDEPAETVKPFVENMGAKMAYRVGLINQDAREAYMAGVSGIPHAFVVDGTGTVVWDGHPAELDGVLPKVIDGTFDVKTAQVKAAAQQELMAALQQKEPDIASAKAAIARIFAVDPVDMQAIGLTVAIAKHEGDSQGLRAFLAALPIADLSAEAANGLAWERATDNDLGDRNLDIALQLIDHGLSLDPASAAMIDTRARILYSLGLVPLAIAEQERACALDPDDDSMRATLDVYTHIAELAASVQDADGSAPALTTSGASVIP